MSSNTLEERIESWEVRTCNNLILKDVRFIGDLFIVGVIPEVAIYIGIGALLVKFVQDKNENTSIYPEDHVEGIIELFDKSSNFGF